MKSKWVYASLLIYFPTTSGLYTTPHGNLSPGLCDNVHQLTFEVEPFKWKKRDVYVSVNSNSPRTDDNIISSLVGHQRKLDATLKSHIIDLGHSDQDMDLLRGATPSVFREVLRPILSIAAEKTDTLVKFK